MLAGVNRIQEAWEFLGEAEYRENMRWSRLLGGVCLLSPSLVFMGCSVIRRMDALPPCVYDRPGEHGLVLLYFAGDLKAGAGLLKPLLDAEGFTHLIWCRGFRGGAKRWRRDSVDDFTRIIGK